MEGFFFNPITFLVVKEMLTCLIGLIWIKNTTTVEVYCEDFEPLNKMA
jgi:hypothetical protein